ncbi:hypothetical protein ACLOJK_036367 [Asimina triloba]
MQAMWRTGNGEGARRIKRDEYSRPRARRAPTNANKLDHVIERVVESRMAQEAIRLVLVWKLEMLQ